MICVARSQILGFSTGFRRRPYNTLALPCECVIGRMFRITCVYAGVDVISAETIMNPINVTDNDNKGKSNIRSPEVVTFLLSLRYIGLDLIYTHRLSLL